MKVEDAIRNIQIMEAEYSHIRQNDSEWDTLELAKEVFEKQIPKEPTPMDSAWIGYEGYCPTCARAIDADEYCCHCGQALKWEVTP